MRPLSQEEILKAFPKKLRKKIKLLNLVSIDWKNLDYLGWIHPSGHLGYMVYEFNNRLKGIILERPNRTLGKGIRMCSLCYTLHPASGVRLFTYRPPSSRITIGTYICADLSCSLYVRNLKNTNIAQLLETISVFQKVKRFQENLRKFFLQIEDLEKNEKNRKITSHFYMDLHS